MRGLVSFWFISLSITWFCGTFARYLLVLWMGNFLRIEISYLAVEGGRGGNVDFASKWYWLEDETL